MKKAIPLLLALALLCGCVAPTGEKLSGLSVGMNKAQVIEVMGQPGNTTASSGKEVLRYPLNAKRAMFTWDFDEYCVVLQDGKVTSYGKASDLNLLKPSD